MDREKIWDAVDSVQEECLAMADAIHDRPEIGMEEYFASGLLEDWLEKKGFQVERGIGGLPTAFRSVFKNGEGGPVIGLLCEYDALPGLGHGCGHHLQGPSILAAAYALKKCAGLQPFTIVVYGTPAEESVSGKIKMIQAGIRFQDLDVAFMMHGGPATQVDIKSLANTKLKIIFHGKSAHAAIKPEAGRSALDGMLLAFQGIEFLREHVPGDIKMHYIIQNCAGCAANVVPAYAEGSMYVRGDKRVTLDGVTERVKRVFQGAAMMTETTVEVIEEKKVDNKIPNYHLNDLVMEEAKAINAPCLRPPRQKTGSTDFGNVMQLVPGTCIRMAFVPEGTSAHSEEYVKAGKGPEAHLAIMEGAKILAASSARLIEEPMLLKAVRDEFTEALAKEKAQ